MRIFCVQPCSCLGIVAPDERIERAVQSQENQRELSFLVFRIEPASKPGELALLLVRIYRSLDALVGGDDAKARAWLAAPNHALSAAPRELLATAEGLVHVAIYLDAMRGRL